MIIILQDLNGELVYKTKYLPMIRDDIIKHNKLYYRVLYRDTKVGIFLQSFVKEL